MRDRRRKLRRCATSPERLLWAVIRNRRFKGLKFRRQASIGPFIVDFLCREKKWIVEIDGGCHDYTEQQDLSRQRFLELEGFKVTRFTNDDVMDDVEAVLMAMSNWLKEQAAEGPSSGLRPPSPPGEKEHDRCAIAPCVISPTPHLKFLLPLGRRCPQGG